MLNMHLTWIWFPASNSELDLAQYCLLLSTAESGPDYHTSLTLSNMTPSVLFFFGGGH